MIQAQKNCLLEIGAFNSVSNSVHRLGGTSFITEHVSKYQFSILPEHDGIARKKKSEAPTFPLL